MISIKELLKYSIGWQSLVMMCAAWLVAGFTQNAFFMGYVSSLTLIAFFVDKFILSADRKRWEEIDREIEQLEKELEELKG